MKKKTKQDFQELLKTEHCKKPELLASQEVTSSGFGVSVWAFWTPFHFSVAALLEGFEIRECISFIEEHINRQVRSFKHTILFKSVKTVWKPIHPFLLCQGLHDRKSEDALSSVHHRKR